MTPGACVPGLRPRRPGPRRRGRRRLLRDRSAAFPVFEAFLVAIIIFTAMLYFTSVQQPTAGRDVLGIDVGKVADNTLGILERREFEVGGQVHVFEEWIALVLEGDTDVSPVVHSEIDELLLTGTRYALRLDNGVEHIHLLPPGDPPRPRAPRAAATFLMPNWTAFAPENATANLSVGAPLSGAGLPPLSDWTALTSPLNSTEGPRGVPWRDWWVANQPSDGQGQPLFAEDVVPLSAPYGKWRLETAGGACDPGPCFLHVTPPGGVPSGLPVYSIQLVVWHGA